MDIILDNLKKLLKVMEKAKEESDEFITLQKEHSKTQQELVDSYVALTALLNDENARLRRLLWLNHGHTGLYGDDGEMQCGACDFKRHDISVIERHLTRTPEEIASAWQTLKEKIDL